MILKDISPGVLRSLYLMAKDGKILICRPELPIKTVLTAPDLSGHKVAARMAADDPDTLVVIRNKWNDGKMRISFMQAVHQEHLAEAEQALAETCKVMDGGVKANRVITYTEYRNYPEGVSVVYVQQDVGTFDVKAA